MNSSLPNVCGTFLIIATGVTSLKLHAEFGRRVRARSLLDRYDEKTAQRVLATLPSSTRCALREDCCLLSGHRRAVLSQPRRQLRLLSRLQVDAVVDALDRLAIGPLRRFNLVRGEKLDDLVAHVCIAERTGRAHDPPAGKWTSNFLHRIPVRQHKIPCQFLAIWIAHYAADHTQRVLRTHVR